MWSRIRPRCAISLGKSIAVAFSNSRSPREYEFATDRLPESESFNYNIRHLGGVNWEFPGEFARQRHRRRQG